MNRIIITCLLLGAITMADAQFYSGSRQEFGKNRVQYRDFEWQYYRFDDLETYFYTGGKDIAQFVAHSAHRHLGDLQRKMDFTLEDRLQFIIYNSQTDFKQSNIGMNGDEAYNIGGVTRIVGTKVFVYYEVIMLRWIGRCVLVWLGCYWSKLCTVATGRR